MLNYEHLEKRFQEDELLIYLDSLKKPQITAKVSRGFSSNLNFTSKHNGFNRPFSVIKLESKHIDFLKGKF